ncbi:MAG TPA: class I SAM-dependent methyltransferase [Phycisphaerales bacterium]|nr:class I SAM-dependent methyltransferase [Phycisphaerales bacterium]
MADQPKTPSQPSSFIYGATRDWPGYFDAVAGKPPRETLLEALNRFNDESPADAIDLGCGEGRDTQELLDRGWNVLAIDGSQTGIDKLRQRPGLADHPRLTTRVSSFEELTDLPKVRLLNASFCIPFCIPEHFDRFWNTITDAIEPGGRFSGQLFGDRDSWAAIPDRSHHTRPEAEALFTGFDLEMFDEEERDKQDFQGLAKRWHVFHIVARKRA